MSIILNPYAFGGGFSDPSDISGLVLWLKADAITGLSDNDVVSTWEDSSSAGNDVTQGTGGLQPTYQTAELNSLPIVRFDGSDYLTSPSISAITSWTFFIVAKSADTSSKYVVGAGSDSNAIIQGYTSGKWEYFSSPRTEIADISTSAFQVITADVGGTATGVWRVGTSWSVTAGTTWPGDIAEIVVYDSALSTGDKTNVQTYLADKYGL